MKRWVSIVAAFLVLALVVGCSNAGSYVKEHYPLTEVIGKGKDTSRIYFAEGQDVPAVAALLAKQEKPKEISEENPEHMFLVYSNKLIHLQQDPENEENTLIEISTAEYVKKHYDSSFLEGFLTGAILNSLFGGWDSSWGGSGKVQGDSTTVPSKSTGDKSTSSGTSPPKAKDSPTTSDRTGSFSSKNAKDDKNKANSVEPAPTSKPKSTGTFSSKSSSKKNDGSTPTYKKPSKPKTSKRKGSFSRRR